MKKTVLPMVLFAFASGVSLPGVAFATEDTPAYSMEDVTACSPDAMRLCKDKLPDIDAIESCMKSNYENLRPACKARFAHSH